MRRKLPTTGYIAHADANRRRFVLLFAGYLLGFQLVGAFALTMILLLVDRQHTILTDPAAYALRYAAPLVLLAALVFWHIYRRHAQFVATALNVSFVERAQEPRFVAIAEEQCTALGVRLPRFGVIEALEPNALTVGTGPSAGMIAVTRGLLDRLDDDELAAVLAHEASHIRQGDTRILAANHALMRTAVLFQTHNVLRIEDWRQLWLPLVLPPVLILMLAGGAATQLSMRYARWAQRGVRLSRDHIADGEAVRVTHFPEALVSALEKIGGHGAFRHSARVDGLLFDGRADREGGTHPTAADRIAAITALGRGLMDPGRRRRDTRGQPRLVAAGAFGRRAAPVAEPHVGRFHFEYDAEGKPLEEPPTPTMEMLWLQFTDRAAYKRWTHGLTAWYEWRASDQRNALGIAPRMILPLAAVAMFLAVFHWPADNDPAKFARIFDPAGAVGWASKIVDFEAPCDEMRFEQGHCKPGARPMSLAQQRQGADIILIVMPLLMFFFLYCAIFRPKTLLWLFRVKKER